MEVPHNLKPGNKVLLKQWRISKLLPRAMGPYQCEKYKAFQLFDGRSVIHHWGNYYLQLHPSHGEVTKVIIIATAKRNWQCQLKCKPQIAEKYNQHSKRNQYSKQLKALKSNQSVKQILKPLKKIRMLK